MSAALFPLALRAYQAGRHGEAANHCRAILAREPQHVPALQVLSAALSAAGKFDEALALARRAVEIEPSNAPAQGALGALLLRAGQPAEALGALDAAARRQPRDAGLHNSRAAALQALGRWPEALAAYDKALRSGPAHPEALLQRGHVLMALRRPQEALAAYDKALAAGLDPRRGHSARGNAELALGRAPAAADSFERVLALAPEDAPALNNLAVAYRRQGRDDDALSLYEALLARDPQDAHARFGRATIHLAHGRFAAGWDDYRWRQSVAEHRGALHQERLAPDLSWETLWLRKDQGLGDELFFLRFAPQLKARGARLIYQASFKLAPLLRRVAAFDAVLDEDAPIPETARVLSAGDLPHVLDHAAAAPPPLALAPLPERVAELRHALQAAGPPPYVGVTWRAGTLESAALYKEAPMTELAAALARAPVTLLSVQRLPFDGETARFAKAAGRKVADFSALNDDLEGMLALMSLLDDYVAVSNTNIHLRAAAGLTSRVLMPMPAEWRWMASGEESPWFPGSRLYRQDERGDWRNTLARLTIDIEAVFSRPLS